MAAMKGLVADTSGKLGQTIPEVIVAAGIAKAKDPDNRSLEVSKVVSGAGTTDDPTVTGKEEVDLSKKDYMTAVLGKDLSGANSMAKVVAGPREKPPLADLGVRSLAKGKIQKK